MHYGQNRSYRYLSTDILLNVQILDINGEKTSFYIYRLTIIFIFVLGNVVPNFVHVLFCITNDF